MNRHWVAPDQTIITGVIGQIYDSALGDYDWSVVVERLTRLLGGHVGTLHRSPSPLKQDVAIRHNADPACVALYNAYYHRLVPATPRMLSLRRPTGLLSGREIPDAEFTRTEYYNDYLRPQGLHGWMAWADCGERGPGAHLTLWRPRNQGSWDEPELAVLQQIGPHLSRGLEIERRLGTVRAAGPEVLSPRQRDCLACAAQGLGSKETARRLGLSVNTVNMYIATTKRKLGAASRSEAVAIACRLGLLRG